MKIPAKTQATSKRCDKPTHTNIGKAGTIAHAIQFSVKPREDRLTVVSVIDVEVLDSTGKDGLSCGETDSGISFCCFLCNETSREAGEGCIFT